MMIRTVIVIVGACAAVTLSIACAVLANGGDICPIMKNLAIPNAAEKPLILIPSRPNDGDTRAYRSGESRSEQPCGVHSISRNASVTSPAKLLAGFFLDTNNNEPTSPITMSG